MPVSKEKMEFDKKCNSKVKLCQNCYFFNPIVFDYEDDSYWDEDLGVFTLWIWKGYCMNESMPNKFPSFYHKTKSNEKCKWFITKKEYEKLAKEHEGEELTQEQYIALLEKLRQKVDHVGKFLQNNVKPENYERRSFR